ncbi:MAG: hypothetical protein HOJ34_02920 [Kordiimonadaceae bacterium]|nr:hypothetical protein [Kordiimonadaceae bacterium]MBT6036295.1 hypothetical protein [Kordiimonadaceae bacterium]MBT6328712.1 hypothetical protein [Kordiimonadaceae bacterium]MBT7583728.1 hypothetical protein [Kordiimonadaceae bacterium]
MTFVPTISILIASVVVLGFAYYKSRQPVEPGKAWTVPWFAVIFISLILILLMFNRLIGLA